jgi:hypothetical protein
MVITDVTDGIPTSEIALGTSVLFLQVLMPVLKIPVPETALVPQLFVDFTLQ